MECVQYLLEQGADPCAETETGDNCLHITAKNGYTECLHKILEASVTIGSGEPARLADTVIPYNNPVKFVDIRNSASLLVPLVLLWCAITFPLPIIAINVLQDWRRPSSPTTTPSSLERVFARFFLPLYDIITTLL